MASVTTVVSLSTVPAPLFVTLIVYCITEPGMLFGPVVPFIGSEYACTDFTTVRLGNKATVTVSAQSLFASLISLTTVPGSALQIPPLFGLTSEPTAVAVTATGAVKEPGTVMPPAVAPA